MRFLSLPAPIHLAVATTLAMLPGTAFARSMPAIPLQAAGNSASQPLATIVAEAAARFYTQTFPDSAMGRIFRAPSDYPSGKKGDVLTVEFTVAGVHCVGLNGGPEFKHNEAFSFQIATDDQEETDRYWNAIVGNGGKESACGWCKDRWGLS